VSQDGGGAGQGDGGREEDRPTRVAIACQGGGSHTAFTAGVLRGLLRGWDDVRFELVGLSGTSGGAFSAVVAWHALVTEGPDVAVDALADLWDRLAADDPADRWINDLGVWGSMARDMGVPTPRPSPYTVPVSYLGQSRLREALADLVQFEEIPALCEGRHPTLVVGTVDVEGGVFETFHDERVTADAVLASAAVPELFPAVEIGGHGHWDGLFSQNPPVVDLLQVPPERKPEEVWIVQINPQTTDDVPVTPEGIAGRRNELAGNLSLNQELRFVTNVNEWLREGFLPRDRFVECTVRRLTLDADLDPSTKLDRRPAFLQSLVDRGERAAESFLAAHPDPEKVVTDGVASDDHD
jgi:NTE family protein